MIFFVALFVRLILLKITSSSCTFSIGLGDMYNEGWQGNYVTVNVGATSTVFTHVGGGQNPTWHNFQVQPGDSVNVQFTTVVDGNNPALTFYSVKDAPDGGGNVMYSFMPQTGLAPNLCLNDCNYSIKLLKNTGENNMWTADNSATVYLNGVPILADIYISNGQISQIFNFGTKVKSTDVITVTRPDVFYLNMGYEVYQGSNAAGQRVYRLVNDDSGPPPSQDITNYCGLNANLAVNVPLSQAPAGSSIPITVFKFIPSTDFTVKVYLVCGSKIKALFGVTLETFQFDIPDDFAGFCYFYAITLDYNRFKFLNSAYVLFYVGTLITPVSGDVTFIPQSQHSAVAQSLSIPGSRFKKL